VIDPNAPTWFDGRDPLAAALPIALGVLICVAGATLFARQARTAAEDI
jgi:hypothetical protein